MTGHENNGYPDGQPPYNGGHHGPSNGHHGPSNGPKVGPPQGGGVQPNGPAGYPKGGGGGGRSFPPFSHPNHPAHPTPPPYQPPPPTPASFDGPPLRVDGEDLAGLSHGDLCRRLVSVKGDLKKLAAENGNIVSELNKKIQDHQTDIREKSTFQFSS